MKFKHIIICIVTAILSFAIGGLYAVYSIKNINVEEFMIFNGPWRVNPSMDLKNPKQRALIALVGLFALRESEVVYYTATMDSDGEALNSKYNYVLEGSVPNARYWSYTLYGSDNFMIPNEGKIYGYNGTSIQYAPKDSLNPELKNITKETYTLHIS